VRDLIGRRLGPYEIRDVVGQGGMATVYRAYQPSLNRFVAIKVLNVVMAQDTEFVARFRQEALAAGGLDHPNILRIYDADSFEGRQYIVMAYAPGGTLAQRLRKGGALPYDEAADTAAQIADALYYAHRRGIVHRDIKPSNILLDEESRPLLADFGIAQAVSGGPRLTQTGSSIGTPDYMSPEQAEGQYVDGRSDLFSLGIVLYQMVTGKMPFQADTSMATMFQVVHQTPLPPRSVNSAIPIYLDSIVQKALAKQPDARFQTGQEMAQALRQRRVVAVPPASEGWDQATQAMRAAPGRQRATPVRQAAALPRRRFAGRGFLFALLVLALVAMLGAGGYLVRDALSARTAQGVTAAPTQVAQVLPTEAPTVPSTEEVLPSPTRSAGGVVLASTPAPTEMPAPTQTPVIVVITVLAPTPTTVPTSTVVPTEAAPSTPIPTVTSRPAPTATAIAVKPVTAVPRPTAAPVVPTTPGTVLDFENFGAWRIGDEPYGAFTASAEQKHGGQTSGKLAYQLPAVAKNYVVFRRVPAATIPGQPSALKLWVYGDGSGHFLNAWVRDSQGEVRQFTFGQITHTGQWQEMTAPLDTAAAWPQAHISGSDNGRLDFPISLDSLVLDGVPDGGGPFSGAIYLDDLSTGDVTAPQADAPAPAANTVPGTPTAPPAASGPPAGLTGHIVYTSGAGGATSVSVLDVANRNTWELRGNARQPDILGDGRVVLNGIGGGKESIFSVNLDGSSERINGMHSEDSYPSWSPTGVSAVFYSTLQGDGKDRIYIQNDMSHAEEPRQLQVNKTDVFGKYPTWLETWRIAFSGCDYWASGSNCGIWTVNSNDSGGPTLVTSDPSDVSTDGAGGVLLLASRGTGNWDVYAVPYGGGTPQNLTNHPSQDAGGTFSPDRRYVAFMSDRDGGWGIWVMNADGSSPQKLAAVPGFGAGWAEERLAWGP
jgi:hypothetical protein